ncbi:MAG: LemA family protein [Clostridia bacterium]|nr:LemA family protein [Clostridia bacterium]
MWIIIPIILVVIIVLCVLCYNGLVASRNKVKEEWSGIDVQLERRFDLIPNLVETVKGYAKHEEETLTKLTELRTSWNEANTAQEKLKLNHDLNGALKSIYAVAENYPDLKASDNFLQLQVELKNTEDKIASSRNNYNSAVNTYNTKIETIPTNIVASLFKFEKADLFEVENEEIRKNVKVSF